VLRALSGMTEQVYRCWKSLLSRGLSPSNPTSL